MSPIDEPSFLRKLTSSIIIRCRSILLIFFNIFLGVIVRQLTFIYRLTKFFGGHFQQLIAVLTCNHYSLVNVADDDFSIRTTVDRLFTGKHLLIDDNPSIHDLFHIYLSKILYESSDRIKDQCQDWGFSRDSIDILTYVQDEDLTKYSYVTQAAVLKHESSKTLTIAFRGTEPMDLLQWMTDASTNFIEMKNIPKNFHVSEMNHVRVHAGFYYALGLEKFNPLEPIDFNQITSKTPMFIQLIRSIEQFRQIHGQCHVTITGHSLGGGLASLFTMVLLSYGYEPYITGVFTYGQPLVGNQMYANILNEKLGHRFHRWVNHCDIVTRIPVIELPSLAWYYARTPYSDALEVAANHNPTKVDATHHRYYHSGLRFKIDSQGHLIKEHTKDQGPVLAREDHLDLFHVWYSINKAFYSLWNITPIRALSWFIAPAEINDHFPGDYARNIKQIVKQQ